MSRRSSIPQRRVHEDSDEDESTSDTPYPTTTSSKRPRLTPAEEDEEEEGEQPTQADESDDNEDSQSEASEDLDAVGAAAIARQPRIDHGVGPGGYKPGAIVRIKMTNFVTYNSAEFFPGPKLNMVIGPNGTGKSTLVCAICLGLGWSPQHLGRAKEPGEFVKHGCSEATIEIELAGQPMLSFNPIISRTISRDRNKNIYKVNGKTCNVKKVRELVTSFSIQVDNLCQFLPQDKVAEFAALTPVELLHSTQRAAAGPDMIQWHDALKAFRAEQKSLQIGNRADREMLKNLEDRQETQREVVERMRERDVIKRKLELLEFVRPVVAYKDYHEEFKALKERKAAVDQSYDRLNKESEPALASLNAKRDYTDRITAAKQYRKENCEKLSGEAETHKVKIQKLEDKIKELDMEIEGERKSSQKHQKEASSVKQNIQRLKRQLEEESVEFDPSYYNERLKEKRLKKRDILAKAEDIKARGRPLAEQRKALQQRIKNSEDQLAHLDSVAGRQEGKLQNASFDSLKAYRWIRENQDKFEKEVFGPPIVTCSVTDPKYADAIESLFSRQDFTAFTVQSRNDFRTLQRHLTGQLKLSDVSIRTCTASLDSMMPPNFDIQRLGFDGWAKDFLKGPDPVVAMLCMENRLAQTPIGLRDISDATYTQMENSPLSTWVSGRHHYQITRRREYGPDAKTSRVRQIKPAQAWTTKPADSSLKQRHLDDIRQGKMEFDEVENTMRSEREELAELDSARKQAEREFEDIESEKSIKQTAHTQWRAIPETITQQEQKLKSFHEQFAAVRERVHGYRIRQDEISLERAEAANEYADAVEKLAQAYEELMKAEMRHLEAKSDVQTLNYRNSEVQRMLEEKREESRKMSEEYKEARRRGADMLKKARLTTTAAKDQDGGEEVLELIHPAEYNMDQLNADIDSKKAELELTHGGNENMVQEFEQRERQIDRLKTKLSGLDQQLRDLSEGIKEVREKWEPKLDALISKISHAFSDSFSRIGCAGQVSLDKVKSEPGPDENASTEYDYDQWSIQIHVKFRENEELALLNAHRQSGGERAVSTIFYLMALQSLSASPFRVVDEINQGMDPRNERMVHGRLVDIACASSETHTDEDGNVVGGGGGGQYFLITPKLLSGLAYKPGMKVLCIYSGEHMPKDYKTLDFRLAIRNMKSIAAQSRRSIGHEGAQAIANHHEVDVYA